MDLTHIFLTVVVFLLAHEEVASTLTLTPTDTPQVALQSFYRLEKDCFGGNLLKIHLHKRTQRQCNATLDGRSTKHNETRFRIINITATGIKCIEFGDDTNHKYALKVVNSNHVAFEKRGCDVTISNEFQFQEVNITTKHFVYKYNNNGLCLGVEEGCNATLKLITPIQTTDGYDRRCYFKKLRPPR